MDDNVRHCMNNRRPYKPSTESKSNREQKAQLQVVDSTRKHAVTSSCYRTTRIVENAGHDHIHSGAWTRLIQATVAAPGSYH